MTMAKRREGKGYRKLDNSSTPGGPVLDCWKLSELLLYVRAGNSATTVWQNSCAIQYRGTNLKMRYFYGYQRHSFTVASWINALSKSRNLASSSCFGPKLDRVVSRRRGKSTAMAERFWKVPPPAMKKVGATFLDEPLKAQNGFSGIRAGRLHASKPRCAKRTANISFWQFL